jgi:hypothetical protein
MGSPIRYCRTLLVVVVVLYPALASAQSLSAYVEEDQLHFRSSNPRLLSNEARQQLRNGATVTYAFRVSVRESRSERSYFLHHCVQLYLWEEKYSRPAGTRYRSASSDPDRGRAAVPGALVVPRLAAAGAAF